MSPAGRRGRAGRSYVTDALNAGGGAWALSAWQLGALEALTGEWQARGHFEKGPLVAMEGHGGGWGKIQGERARPRPGSPSHSDSMINNNKRLIFP